MNTRIVLIIIIALLLNILVVICAAETPESSGNELLLPVSDSLQESLDTIDRNLSEIAQRFGDTDGNTSIDSIISQEQINQPGWGGVILIEGNKTQTILNPLVITQPVNTTITEDPAIKSSITYIKPKMGQLRDISGADQGVVVSRPAVVHSLIGSAAGLIIPWSLCETLIRPSINGTNNMSVIMQGDGTILYTSHPNELTKIPPDNFSTEFPTFRDVKTAMMTQKEGHIIYELWRAEREDPHAREAYWNTISLHGNEWRVMIADAIK